MWYTPLTIITKVKNVLGDIDLDPASDDFGNARIQAKHIITEESNGLLTEWPSDMTVFINPPGGKLGNQSKTVLFWQKLMNYRSAGNLKHAIFLCFSIEAAQNTQKEGYLSVMELPFCVPKKRVHFDSQDGKFSAPSHSNLIVYIPGTINKTKEFVKEFSDLGITRY